MPKKPGYILVLTIMILMSMTFLVTRLLRRSLAGIRINAHALDREQAKCLALSGISLAQASLMHQENDVKAVTNFLQTLIVEDLNTWQNYTLKKEIDGIDGQIAIYISCEEGKLSLNNVWNFKTKKFITTNGIDYRKLLDNVILKSYGKKIQERKIIEELSKALKDHQRPLESLTELFNHEYFKGLAQTFFLTLPTKKDSLLKTQIALSDIFTESGRTINIQPLFLSKSIEEIFELNKIVKDPQEIKKIVYPLISKKQTTVDWQKEWDTTLKKLYGKAYNQLSKDLIKLFDTTIGVTTISVVSYGTIGSVTQKLYALLKKNLSANKQVTYTIKKIYWI